MLYEKTLTNNLLHLYAENRLKKKVIKTIMPFKLVFQSIKYIEINKNSWKLNRLKTVTH